MFDRIAPRYDLLNRILSLGLDQSWRRRAIRSLALAPGARLLDVATGTADMALMAERLVPGIEVLGTDPSPRMLEVGRRKVDEAGLSARITLQEGDARCIDLPDASVDGVVIAFGIRNVPDRAAALREMARVTRPTGRVAVLELLEPSRGALAPFARLWCHHAVPLIGAALSGAHEYRYLQRSVETFPRPERFAATMGEAGLDVLEARALGFGACGLFVARPALGRRPS